MSDYKITREEYEDAQNVVWDYEEQLKTEANDADKSTERVLNLPVVTIPLLWKDVLDDFYVEHDRQISNGEYKGKMILVFRDWLEKNYQVPERNGW